MIRAFEDFNSPVPAFVFRDGDMTGLVVNTLLLLSLDADQRNALTNDLFAYFDAPPVVAAAQPVLRAV